MAAPSAFLYPIIHEFKKAECVPTSRVIVQEIDLKGFSQGKRRPDSSATTG
jgi:hypothetical protein